MPTAGKKDAVDDVAYWINWLRGSFLLWEPDGTRGRDFSGKHFWIVVSRDDINKNGKLPVIVVPVNTKRRETSVTASDIEVDKNDSPTGKPIVIRCGHIRTLDRGTRNLVVAKRKYCSDELMRLIDEKLIEVLELEMKYTPTGEGSPER